MRNEPVVCYLGPVWWIPFLLAVGGTVVGLLELAGCVDVLPLAEGPPAALAGVGLTFALMSLWSWRRLTAADDGLLVERVIGRRRIPWADLGIPGRADLAPVSPITFRYDEYEPAVDQPFESPGHANLLVDRDGRLICRVGPQFSNRTPFMIAVHRHLRS